VLNIKKFKYLFLPLLSAPFFFIITAEFFHKNILSNNITTLFVSVIATAICCRFIWIWERKLNKNLIFNLSSNLVIGAKRTSVLAGFLLAFPLAFFIFDVIFLPKYTSIIPSIVAYLGLSVICFIIGATLSNAIFWCIDGFINNKNNLEGKS